MVKTCVTIMIVCTVMSFGLLINNIDTNVTKLKTSITNIDNDIHFLKSSEQQIKVKSAGWKEWETTYFPDNDFGDYKLKSNVKAVRMTEEFMFRVPGFKSLRGDGGDWLVYIDEFIVMSDKEFNRTYIEILDEKTRTNGL